MIIAIPATKKALNVGTLPTTARSRNRYAKAPKIGTNNSNGTSAPIAVPFVISAVPLLCRPPSISLTGSKESLALDICRSGMGAADCSKSSVSIQNQSCPTLSEPGEGHVFQR